MALKKIGQKRPASASNQRYHKKHRYSSVVDALKEADLPTDTKRMLCHAVKLSLAGFADERHPFQTNLVEMTEETLVGIEKSLEAAVTTAHEKIITIDESKLQVVVLQHARVRAELKCAVASKEAALVEARMHFKQAEEAFNASSKQQKVGNADYSRVLANKQTFDCMVQRLDAMKGEENAGKAISKLQVELKSFGVDTSVAATLYNVLVKPVAERGEFDALTLANLHAELASKGAEMVSELSVLEPARVEREATATSAQAVYDGAKMQAESTKAALSDAQKAASNGEEALDVAENELKHIGKNLRSAQEGLKQAEKKLADFQNGALLTFRELASHRTAPALEEEVGDVD